MRQEPPFVQVGSSEPEHEGGHDESGHSSSSIILKTLAGLSLVAPADPITSNEEAYPIPDSPDPNVSDQETDSITDSVGSLVDSDYGGDPMDADEQDSDYSGDPMDADEHNPMDYLREVYAAVEETIQTNNLDGVIDRINSIRKSYDMVDADCVHHLFYWMMKSALETPHVAVDGFDSCTWKDLLRTSNLLFSFLKDTDMSV